MLGDTFFRVTYVEELLMLRSDGRASQCPYMAIVDKYVRTDEDEMIWIHTREFNAFLVLACILLLLFYIATSLRLS